MADPDVEVLTPLGYRRRGVSHHAVKAYRLVMVMDLGLLDMDGFAMIEEIK